MEVSGTVVRLPTDEVVLDHFQFNRHRPGADTRFAEGGEGGACKGKCAGTTCEEGCGGRG
jgi:hypothetical protein